MNSRRWIWFFYQCIKIIYCINFVLPYSIRTSKAHYHLKLKVSYLVLNFIFSSHLCISFRKSTCLYTSEKGYLAKTGNVFWNILWQFNYMSLRWIIGTNIVGEIKFFKSIISTIISQISIQNINLKLWCQ